MTAAQSATAIASGWHRARPTDEIKLLPLSDGGPGFISAIVTASGGDLIQCEVSGPTPGSRVNGEVLLVAPLDPGQDPRRTAYIESAQACGLHLIDPEDRDPRLTSTTGVAELMLEAIRQGAGTLVIGLGGSGTNDGGAGMLAGLGATALNAHGEDATDELRAGGAALQSIASVDLSGPRSLLASIRLVAASDVDVPLLGEGGASLGFSRQKGAEEHHTALLERALRKWSKVAGEGLASAPSTGAAGGLGYGLALLGAESLSGSATVLDAVRFTDHCSDSDVVITGEGRVDWQSLRGKLVGAVIEQTRARGATSIVLAGDSEWESRSGSGPGNQYGLLQATRLHTVVGQGHSPTEAKSKPEALLSDLAEQVARAWKA